MPSLQENIQHTIGEDLYWLLPERYRTSDYDFIVPMGETERIGFVQRFFRTFGDTYDSIRERYGALLDWHDPRMAPADILAHLSMNYGWPLDTSLSESTQRLMIQNIRTITDLAGRRRGIWMAIYLHTGITVKQIMVNDKDALRLYSHTRLAGPYCSTDTYITVNDSTMFRAGQVITCTNGSKRSADLIKSVDQVINRIYLTDGFSYSMPSGSIVVRGTPPRNRRLGTRGLQGFMLGQSRMMIHALRSRNKKLLDQNALERLTTTALVWPYEPSDSIKALGIFLAEYMKPARDHVTQTYKSYDQNKFVLGLSRLGLSDYL